VYGALSGLISDVLSMGADLLYELAPLYALPIGLGVVFAIGYWIRSMLTGD